MAISSNMASKRSSQKEAMKPILKDRESYSAMSFTDAAGGYSHRHQSAIVQELSPRDRSLRQMPLRGMRMCRCRAIYHILHAHQHLTSCYLKLSIVLFNPSRASTGIFSTPT